MVEAKSVAVHDDGLESCLSWQESYQSVGCPTSIQPWLSSAAAPGPCVVERSTPVPAVTCAKMLWDPERDTSPFVRKPSLSNRSTNHLGLC